MLKELNITGHYINTLAMANVIAAAHVIVVN